MTALSHTSFQADILESRLVLLCITKLMLSHTHGWGIYVHKKPVSVMIVTTKRPVTMRAGGWGCEPGGTGQQTAVGRLPGGQVGGPASAAGL